MDVARLIARLDGARPAEVRVVLEELGRCGGEAALSLDALAVLLDDPRHVDCGNPGAPQYTAIAALAITAMVQIGQAARGHLQAAARSASCPTIPLACYDQGFYIGDYTTETISVADEAARALQRLGP